MKTESESWVIVSNRS